jgi:hypothetical protein
MPGIRGVIVKRRILSYPSNALSCHAQKARVEEYNGRAMMPTPSKLIGYFRMEAIMGHSNEDRPGLGLVLALVFVMLFSVYASVASAQAPEGGAAAPGGRVATQVR